MKMLPYVCAIIMLSGAAGSALADGPISCDVPKNEWRPRNDLAKQLKAMGWKIQKFQIYNGCYEIYGYDEKQKFVEAFFNPKTFERVFPAAE